MPIIIIFIVIPLAELAVFGAVSEEIGVWTALLFALLTAIIGGYLVKLQGLQTVSAMRQSMDKGQMPVSEMFDGFCLVAAGALLITPGFLTDAVGFALLVPGVRVALRHAIKSRANWESSVRGGGFTRARREDDADIIDGEYERVDPQDPQIPPEDKR